MRPAARLLRRWNLRAALLAALFALSHASLSGPLLPWSPVRPGYASVRAPGIEVVYPRRAGLPPGLGRPDRILAEAARLNRLDPLRPVTVVATDRWEHFRRGALLGWDDRPIPVLGAAMQTGTVVWLSPLVWEAEHDAAAALRHELTHALMFQRMPLPRTFGLVRLDEFEEGLAVAFGNPGDYPDLAAWLALAGSGYRFGPDGDPRLEGVPAELRGGFRLAEYREWTRFLLRRHGPKRFFAWRDAVLRDPGAYAAAFPAALGETREEAVRAWEAEVRRLSAPSR